MNCTRCGAPLAPDSKFCPNCGAIVPRASDASGAPPVPPPYAPPVPPPPYPGAPVRPRLVPPASGPEGTAVPAPPDMIGDCIRTGWAAFQREGVMLVLMYLVYAILTAGPDYTFKHAHHDHCNFVIRFGSGAMSTLLYPGFIVAGLKAVRGAKVEFLDLFAGFRRLGAVLVYSILGGLATALGMVLLILPGIIVALGLSQAGFLVFDRGLGGLDALKASWKLMVGYRWPLFLLMLALIGINILGLLALCIGLLVTMPLTSIILAVFYERLRLWNGGVLSAETRPAGITAG